jgi:hypothetical protein
MNASAGILLQNHWAARKAGLAPLGSLMARSAGILLHRTIGGKKAGKVWSLSRGGSTDER